MRRAAGDVVAAGGRGPGVDPSATIVQSSTVSAARSLPRVIRSSEPGRCCANGVPGVRLQAGGVREASHTRRLPQIAFWKVKVWFADIQPAISSEPMSCRSDSSKL